VHRSLQALGCALVAGYSDTKESDPVVWSFFSRVFFILLDIKNIVVRKVCFYLLLAITLINCSGRSAETNPADAANVAVNELPRMTITLLDNSRLDLHQLQGSAILIFFQPECDHCQHAAGEIRENILAFRKHQLYFITSQSLEASGKFAETYQLSGNENVHFSWTPMEQVLDNYGPISAPSIYIYSADHQLVKSFSGDLNMPELLKYI
jgi:AhpC/TSA family